MTRRGRAYTPIKTHLAEDVIRDGWDGPKFEGPLFMKATFTREGTTVTVGTSADPASPLRGDIDNYVKLVMDGLNGAAYADDNQIVYLEVHKQ
jgi:Holliday junction resolvase RusA-like endonuclease